MADLVWAILSSMAIIAIMLGAQVVLPEPVARVEKATRSHSLIGLLATVGGWLLPPKSDRQ